ncbi:copper amine oxidase N-terminal domain-containing protein [Brevibacillus dissolubilis]|uniref:copper amine oxidase N-terminal domain-containing protein n=1 Tax=Brevibacillus dissolubilis TaxID=1844116 RepID=UPI0021004E0F|nr:copper amine oxidase N-terminal domain-containing protein [Brevibacillus dissolubilis]
MLKRQLSALLLAVTLVPASAYAATPVKAPVTAVAQADIKVQYNGKALAFPDQKPVIKNSRTLVPIRPIAEGLGFDVQWDNATRKVSINKGTSSVNLIIDQKTAKKNEQTLTLDVPAQIINGRTMVPVRFIAEALNYQVNWSQATTTVLITDPVVVTPTQPTTPTTPTQPQTPTPTPTQPQTPSTGAELIQDSTVSGKLTDFLGKGIYYVGGKVEAGSTVTVEFGGQSYEAKMKADGTFEVIKGNDSLTIGTYKVTAVKDGKTDSYQGTFSKKSIE